VYLAPLFTLHYWYTCSSTVGLSLRGHWLAAGAGAVLGLWEITTFFLSDTDHSTFAMVATAALSSIALVQPVLVMKALSRVEVGRMGWCPYVRREKATHRERTSARTDARTGWPVIAIVGVFSWAV
jgi:hypothetical protein